ncbi:hypothetical protein [Poriferisphaera sp. WC338]|uniref:hypothetical protein n=1 Tax=Poriferisphaera sp. WC338 TaxID=3425129 RepID=UPI003D8196E0
MDKSWLDQLFGLQDLSFNGIKTELGWLYEMPAWLWAMTILAVFVFSGWCYSRLLGKRWVRLLLSGTRAVILTLIVVLLVGPMLVKRDEVTEPDVLVVMVDRSASMTVKDMHGLGGDAYDFVSRDEMMRDVLARNKDFLSGELGKREVVWLGFDREVRSLTNVYPQDREDDKTDNRVMLDEAIGDETRLVSGVAAGISLAGGRPIAGMIVISDGRSAEPISSDVISRLRERGVGVYAVPLGGERLPYDVAIRKVVAPRRAFTADKLPIRVQLEQVGGAEAGDVTITVREADGGEVLATQLWQGGEEDVTLEITTGESGIKSYVIEAVSETINEQTTRNNQHVTTVEVIDRPIRVLYVEGYPRWEYRYLKNMLIREKSIWSSLMLISADRGFAQEGDEPITRLPMDAVEMEKYDVVIVGDVPGGYLSGHEMNLIKQQVSLHGAGLIMIGGERYMPGVYEGTVFEELLPMARAEDVGRIVQGSGEWVMRPADNAASLGVLKIGDAEDWPADLPAVRWVQSLGPLKVTSEVLGEWIDAENNDPKAEPAVVRMRYGAGQVLYIGTDEIWRWRYGKGEQYFEQFWVQLIRMLGRSRVQQEETGLSIRLSNHRIDVGSQMVVELLVSDGSLDERKDQVRLEVRQQQNQSVVDELVLHLQHKNGTEQNRAGRVYRGIYVGERAGAYELVLGDWLAGDRRVSEKIQVIASADEMQHLEADHAKLRQLAEASGGQVIPVNQIEILPEVIPNRARVRPNDHREKLAHAPLIFGLILGLLVVEWIGRKAMKLV